MNIFTPDLLNLRAIKPNLSPKETIDYREKQAFETQLGLCQESIDSFYLLYVNGKFHSARIILDQLILNMTNTLLTANRLPVIGSLDGLHPSIWSDKYSHIEKLLTTVVGWRDLDMDAFQKISKIDVIYACQDELIKYKKRFPATSVDVYYWQKRVRTGIAVFLVCLIALGAFKVFTYPAEQRAKEQAKAAEQRAATRAQEAAEKARKRALAAEQEAKDKAAAAEQAAREREYPDIARTRMSDLEKIKDALDKYHAKNGVYPLGYGPDSNFTQDGLFKDVWIEGLVPEYIDKLPRDARRRQSKTDQYLYWSDGADYKLVAHGADDCNYVRSIRPELIDVLRNTPDNCWAYGYWTQKAAKW